MFLMDQLNAYRLIRFGARQSDNFLLKIIKLKFDLN
jgi:hypothetical protein